LGSVGSVEALKCGACPYLVPELWGALAAFLCPCIVPELWGAVSIASFLSGIDWVNVINDGEIGF
jgi:hypothetical protein